MEIMQSSLICLSYGGTALYVGNSARMCKAKENKEKKQIEKRKKSGNYMVLESTKHIESEKITKNRSGNFLLQGEKKSLIPGISREA